MAEHPVDLGAGGVGILDGVVQQRRRYGGVVELEIGENRGDFEGMGNVGVARRALLLAVRAHGIDIGAVEQLLVGLRIVLLDPVEQLVLPHLARFERVRRRLAGHRQQIRAARRRRPRPGLVLHPRQIQIGRRARHDGPLHALVHALATASARSVHQGRSQRYHGVAPAPQAALGTGPPMPRVSGRERRPAKADFWLI